MNKDSAADPGKFQADVPELILASASPRRADLLTRAGFQFRIVRSTAAEYTSDSSFHWSRLALLNAQEKAGEVADRFPGSVVIGADTVIEFGGTVIGKPVDLADARRILTLLSGNVHTVTTGVCVIQRSTGSLIRFAEQSRVHFQTLSDAVISSYLAQVEVLDKAGAYAIQEHGDLIIAGVCGSESNIIGLPVERLAETLHTVFRFP